MFLFISACRYNYVVEPSVQYLNVRSIIFEYCRLISSDPTSFFFCPYASLVCIGNLNLLKAQFCTFQNLGFHDHTFNREKLANYVVSHGFYGQAFHGEAREFSCPGFHDKQQKSLPMHCNDSPDHFFENNSCALRPRAISTKS